MRARRSGIANVVGAVFFILIVVLMVGALILNFNTFNNAIGGQHISAESTLLAQQQQVSVQNLVFGGLTSYDGFSFTARGSVFLNPNSEQQPILPISNMNLTSGMQGWTTSHSYTLSSNRSAVGVSPQFITYNGTYPSSNPTSVMSFNLNFTNNDALGQPYEIARVSVLVDQNWGVPSIQPVTLSWGPSATFTNNPPSVVGNNITWVSSYPGYDIGPGQSQGYPSLTEPLTWTAIIPRTYGTFYNTVVVSWIKNDLGPGDCSPPGPSCPFVETTITTTNATITLSEVSRSGTLGTSKGVVLPDTPGAMPSGVSAGYDANAMTTSSESGPGSMYIDYKPSFNSVPLADGQQLTSNVNFTTSFSLDSATAASLTTSGCCTLSWASSLDGINAPRNSLILYKAYLTQSILFSGATTAGTLATTLQDTPASWTPSWWVGDYLQYTSGPALGQTLEITANTANTIMTGAFNPAPTPGGGDTFIISGQTYELPVGGTSPDATACGITPHSVDYVNPTAQNDFNPSGWVNNYATFNPSTCSPAWLNPMGEWYSGTYTLTMTVTMTVPGQNPHGVGYPPGVSIHLDDIGLALRPQPTTSYGTTTFEIPTGLTYAQVQGLEVGINATVASQAPLGPPANTTIYAYVADNSRFVYNPVLWVQIGSATFMNAATIDSFTALPNAAYYMNLQSGSPEVGDLAVRVNATSPISTVSGTFQVNLVVYAVVQTFNQTRAVVEFKNQGTTPLNLLSLVISGPGSASSATFPLTFFVSSGQTVVLPVNLIWLPGQVYTATVTTTGGVTYSRSFTAPLS